MISLYLVGGVIAFIVAVGGVVLAFWFMRNKKKPEQASDNYMERLESEVGLDKIAKAELKVKSAEAEAKREEAAIQSAEALQEKVVGWDKGAKQAVMAVEKGAEAAEHEEAVQEATTTIEARGIGIEAAIKKIINAIVEYTSKKKENILTEGQEALVVDNILNKIKEATSHKSIDDQTSDYLRQYMENLVSAFGYDIELEGKKEELMAKLVNELKDDLTAMKFAVEEAKKELKGLQSEEKKTRKTFNKELKDFEASLRTKSKQIDELGKDKSADPVLTVKLIRDRDLRGNQLKNAKSLNDQLEAIYGYMKTMTKHMKVLLINILQNEKIIKKYDDKLNGRKKQIKKRLISLKGSLSQIEKIEQTKILKPHKIALGLSKSLKSYFEVYKKNLEEDIKFDNWVKEITIKSCTVSQQMEAFQKLTSNATESEKNVQYGEKILMELIKGTVDETSQKNITSMIEVLEKERKILGYEKAIESFMKKLAHSLENKSKEIGEELQNIIDKDKNLIEQIEKEKASNSYHIGNIMASIFKRKIEIDAGFKKDAVQFSRELKGNNDISAKAYSEIMQKQTIAKI